MSKYSEAIEKFNKFVGFEDGSLRNIGYRKTFDLALEALRAAEARENPKPLTLKEFSERIGKPVYIERTGQFVFSVKGWQILMKIDIGDTSWANTHFKGGGCLQTSTYGKDWTAYDYPPKEAQP